jgi:hypothetical protein
MNRYELVAQNGQSCLIDGFVIVGRNPDKSIMEGAKLFVVNDLTKTISKTHAAVAVNDQGQLLIEDLESTNGTFIEGVNEFEEQVFNGDPKVVQLSQRIRLGDVYFTVRDQSSNASASATVQLTPEPSQLDAELPAQPSAAPAQVEPQVPAAPQVPESLSSPVPAAPQVQVEPQVLAAPQVPEVAVLPATDRAPEPNEQVNQPVFEQANTAIEQPIAQATAIPELNQTIAPNTTQPTGDPQVVAPVEPQIEQPKLDQVAPNTFSEPNFGQEPAPNFPPVYQPAEPLVDAKLPDSNPEGV